MLPREHNSNYVNTAAIKENENKKEMQSHENCLSYKVRSKDIRNNEKLDLSGKENKFQTAYKFIRKESK